MRFLFSLVTVGLLAPAPVLAQAQPEPDAGAQRRDAAPEIVVTAHPLRDLGLMAGSVELEGDALVRVAAPQIGDMLAKLPGVSATAFAPGASRPVLRGLTGDRVKVLLDGLGAIDASSVSADHGVALDTLTIDHIDVLHGPALLAFGGQAIGGAVNAFDKRIPRRMPQDGFDLTALASIDSVADGKSAAASLDLALAPQVALHFDAGWRDSNDMRVGGRVLSAPLAAEVRGAAAGLRASGDTAGAAELDGLAAARGRVRNSFARGAGFGAGLAFIDDGGNLGVSVQRIDSRYGIPARPLTGEEGVTIDMAQTRVDLRGERKLGGFLDSVILRAAYGDYTHDELEDGAVGTHFARQGVEARLELVQAERGGWTGRSGVQFSGGSLRVTGDEAILPNNRDRRLGVFTLQSVKLGRFEIEGAGRIERVAIRARAAGFDRRFTLASAAAGLAHKPTEALKLGVNLSHGERAPSPEELLTDGLHVATQAFEVGDPAFGRERSNAAEAYARYAHGGTTLNLTAYLTEFKGFITAVPTGATIEGFPVFTYRQQPARFRGFEAQASRRLAAWGERSLTLDATADHVRATLKRAGPVPRIPPLRIMGGLEYATPAFTLRGEVEWNAAQRRVGPLENPTGAFTLVNASLSWRPLGEEGPLTLILTGDNLLDALGRRAASFTRDFVPIAGRNLRLSGKLSF